MPDYTWIKGLLTLSTAPNITTFKNLGLNVVLPFKGAAAQPLGLAGAKMIPNGSAGAWKEEAKYNVVAYFMEDEPEIKNISPDEIIRRIRLCRSQTSLPITCIFTGYFYNRTENNWNTRYAEVIRELDFVCVDVYFYRYGSIRETDLNYAKKSIEIIQGLGKPVVGVAQGHEEAKYNNSRPDIVYVDNFWRNRGCGVIYYAWNVGEASIGNRGGIDDWYNQEIAKVNEGIVEAYTCPQCGETFGSQAELDAHIASEHPTPVFTCPQCPATFDSQAELDAHIASKHPSNGAKEMVFYSEPAYDGHICDKDHDGNGDSMNITGFDTQKFNWLGQEGIWYHRGFISFNTSGIPDNAVIDSVYIRIYVKGDAAQTIVVDYSLYGTLGITDYQRTPEASAITTFAMPTSWQWKKSGTFINVNKTGRSQYRLRAVPDSSPRSRFASGDGPYPPELYVTYHIPEEPPPVFTCPQCGATFATQADLDAHIATMTKLRQEITIAEEKINELKENIQIAQEKTYIVQEKIQSIKALLG